MGEGEVYTENKIITLTFTIPQPMRWFGYNLGKHRSYLRVQKELVVQYVGVTLHKNLKDFTLCLQETYKMKIPLP